MIDRSNSRWLASVCLTATLAIGAVAAASSARQAAAAPPAPTIATPEDAKPFLGLWTTTLESPQGPLAFDIDVHLDSGDPGATVSNSLVGESAVTDVTKAGSALVLRYVVDVQGMQVSVVISLVPEDEQLKAHFSFLDGQFATSGIATRKKQ